jgi:hypothetical protein
VSERNPPSRSRQIDRRWSLLALLLIFVEVAVLVGVAQFTGGSAPGESASTMTPYEQLWAQVRPDGTVSKEVALQAFALAIAPLPGVTPPGGAATPLYERADGTFAIDWLAPYVDELTPDQKAAVQAALTPNQSAPAITPSADQSDMVLVADDITQAYYDGLVHDAIPKEAARLGRGLNLTPDVTINPFEVCEVNPQTKKCEDALAYTNTFFGIFGAQGCHIFVNPSLTSTGDGPSLRATMAHETFHCFQIDYLDQNGSHYVPSWIWEGEAEYAGESIAGPSMVGQGWWRTYLTTIQVPLYERGYDALGFYQHMSEEGIDPWEHFDAMLAVSTDNDAAFKASGADADVFLDTWASGEFRDGSLGGAWNAQGPWNVSDRSEPVKSSVGNGDTVALGTPKQVNEDVAVSSGADLVELTTSQGHIRLHTDPPGDETDTAERWLCTAAGGCKCPDGEAYAGPDYDTVASDFQLALTGGLTGASGTLTGRSFDQFCKPIPTIPAQKPCTTSCPDSNGDPHLRTTNDYRYDFQGAGEFVLLRNADDSIDIQGREQPYGDSKAVAVNTAVAVRDNGHRVGIYASPSGRLAVKVDGAGAGGTTDLGAGASVHPFDKGIEVDFPDGSILWALSVGPWGINALLQPSDQLRAEGVGLLGPITPGNLGVPALPDGTILPAAPDAHTRFVQVYGPFADAWRVTDATSLFDYGPGQSTATFTDRTFPNEAAETALASFSPDALAAAESACANVTNPELQPECIFDVAATGDAGFADQYVAQQDLYDSGIATPPPASPSPSASSPGMHDAVKVTDLANLTGAAVGPDDTVYLSIDDGQGNAQILAVDPHTASVRQAVPVRVSTDLHFAAGSLWAAGLNLDSNFQDCNVTRFDPSTLAVQATFPIACSFNYPGPKLVSSGDTVWVVDTSNYDLGTDSGAKLAQIDPATNTPGRTVDLATNYGGFFDSQGALFCRCGQGNSDVYRLTSDGSSLEDLGNYIDLYPAGTGFWSTTQAGGDTVVYVTGAGAPAVSLTLTGDETLVGGDTSNAYVQGEGNVTQPGTQLLRQPADGSSAVPIANAPTWDSPADLDYTSFDYLTGNPTKFATPDGFVTMWIFQGSLYLQWAPIG